MNYYAKSDWKTTVKAHCDDVARLAESYGREIGMEHLAGTAALFHDAAKYADLFQDVLHKKAAGVDHACTGAAMFDLVTRRKCRHGVEAIAGHHDRIRSYPWLRPVLDEIQSSKPSPSIPSGKQPAAYGQAGLAAILERFKSERPDFEFQTLETLPATGNDWKSKLEYMLDARFLLSCLVDADYTSSRMESDGVPVVSPREKEFPARTYLENLRRYRSDVVKNSKADPKKNRLRNTIYDDCATAGKTPTDRFYTLTAPTGSGKTLGMLKFALERCAADPSKKRIIIVLPFLSISDQVEKIVRQIIPDCVVDNSQVDLDEDRREAAERWDADCIVTTTVQFFGSLFSDRPADCRKLHRMANAMLLFDEVQALPYSLSRALMHSLSHVSEKYNACICLSTATQPAYGKIKNLGFTAREIIRDVGTCFAEANTTGIEFREKPASLESIAEEATRYNNVCVIVNLKSHADAVYARWTAKNVENTFMLSTNIAPADRKTALDEIRRLQSEGRPVRVVSTQCIEAGIDLDFGKIFRTLAPLTALIQAAGRQNRNGTRPAGHITVFEPDTPSKYPDPDYERRSVLVKILLSEGMDVNSLNAVATYYERLFTDLDRRESYMSGLETLDFENFAAETRLIRRSGFRVIVPCESDIATYQSILNAMSDGTVTRGHLRKAAKITVQTYDEKGVRNHCTELLIHNRKTGAEIRTGIYILLNGHETCYDRRTGLRLSKDVDYIL